MKIGLDVHGVIDQHIKFFGLLSSYFIENGHEVHIITGMKKSEYDKTRSDKYMPYTYFYSITDDLLTKLTYILDIHDRPRFNEYDWNTAKAKYCKEKKIDIMLDDSDIYSKYFTTPYFKIRKKK